MKNKLVLGSAQIGLNYGVNNLSGRVSDHELERILKLAKLNNIEYIDTASLYGNSEERLGYAKEKYNLNFKFISKLPNCQSSEVKQIFENTLQKLRISKIFGYLFHDFSGFKKNEKSLEILYQLKEEGLIENIGFSIYHKSELEYLFETNIDFEIIEFPYSIFDQRFSDYFELLKSKGVKIFVRSVYLQGLVFKHTEELIGNFQLLRPKIEILNSLVKKTNSSISSLCFNFVKENSRIDNIVVGFDNSEQLKSILNDDNLLDESTYEQLVSLREENEQIILPIYW